MNRKVFLAVILFPTFLAGGNVSTQAELPWQGTQYQFMATGSLTFNQKESSGLNTSILYWDIPADGSSFFFSYTGPWLKLKPWLWLSPQIGVLSENEGDDRFITALWTKLSFAGEKIKVLSQIEGYFRAKERNLFTYHSLDFPLEKFNLGFQEESLDDQITYGPHFGFGKGMWHSEIQWHLSFQDKNRGQAIRFLNSIEF
ncbi:MAG: hypothetical protein PHR36_00720 [Patescibacteria group bacterium]|nr:hypothetical protein [Patescibacteria group bacterium]